ncbi:MAG: DNA pilot protein [Microvirus sp.]|nr:MAG: DNA pilot protein [Microvirus sp.]
MSWSDNDWSNLGGGILGGLGGATVGFLTGGPAGALAGGIGGAGAGWSASANANAQKDANFQNMQLTRESWARDDSAVQRRAADMQAAGFNPMLAAGSPAGNSVPQSVKPVQQNYIGDVTDAVLKGVQTGKALSETEGQSYSNQLAKDTLQAKRTIARVDAMNASLGLYAKSDDPFKKGLTDMNMQGDYGSYLVEARKALISQLRAEGYSSSTKGFQSALAEFDAKWAKEADSMGAGYAEGVGKWTSAGGKVVPGASLLIGPRKPK